MYQTDIEVLVNGKPIKKIAHEGRTYIQANKGSKYSIKIKNNSCLRRLFCVSVDGINVIDGKAAGSTNQGYVLNGYSSYEIAGFRTSNEEVHPFKFNDKQKSYAAKSDETGGDVSSCGVIGIKVYDEKIKPFIWEKIVEKPVSVAPWWQVPRYGQPSWTANTSAPIMMRRVTANNVSYSNDVVCNYMAQSEPTYAAKIEESPFQAGTEFSKESMADRVSETEFEIGSFVTTIEIFYDYREGLVSLGVPLAKEVKITMPQAFPSCFCKPPKD